MSGPLIAEPVRCPHCGRDIEWRRGQVYIQLHHLISSAYLEVEVKALGGGDFAAGLVRITEMEMRPETHRDMRRAFWKELEPLRPAAKLEYDANRARMTA